MCVCVCVSGGGLGRQTMYCTREGSWLTTGCSLVPVRWVLSSLCVLHNIHIQNTVPKKSHACLSVWLKANITLHSVCNVT